MFKKSLAALVALAGASVAFAQTAVPAAAAASAVTITATEVGFFATAVSFVAAFLLTWPAIIAIVLFGVLAEHNDSRGWSIFFTLLGAFVAFFFFNVSLLSLAFGVVAYIGLGLVWSFYRYKRYAVDIVEKNRNATSQQKDQALRDLHPTAMLGTITSWVMVWPYSLVANFIGDLIDGIQILIKKVFRGIYFRIYDAAVSSLSK